MRDNNEPLICILNEASHQIRDLRRANEIMAAKLDVYETFKRIIMGAPGPQGMSPDILFTIEKEIMSLEDEDKRRPRAA